MQFSSHKHNPHILFHGLSFGKNVQGEQRFLSKPLSSFKQDPSLQQLRGQVLKHAPGLDHLRGRWVGLGRGLGQVGGALEWILGWSGSIGCTWRNSCATAQVEALPGQKEEGRGLCAWCLTGRTLQASWSCNLL